MYNNVTYRKSFQPVILVSSIGVQLDDCNFHESVDLTDFDSTKTLAVSPTDGEVGITDI
jgi:hypothetical protein